MVQAAEVKSVTERFPQVLMKAINKEIINPTITKF